MVCRTDGQRPISISAEHGYGFIQPAGGGEDVFVHGTALERSGMRALNEGQKIIFELQTDRLTGRTSAVILKAAV